MSAPMQGLPAGGSVPPGGPPNPSMPPQHPNQPQAGHSSQGQTSTTEVKFDNVAKVKALVWSLKDALSNLVRVAATNIYHTAAVDNGVRANTSDESTPPRLDKALEDFFSICNQIELNLVPNLSQHLKSLNSVYQTLCIERRSSVVHSFVFSVPAYHPGVCLQLRDSHQYLPVPVVATKPDPSNPQDGNAFLQPVHQPIRAQTSFAKAVQDVLNEGARRMNQPE
ncbi:hypothetical protein HPB50_021248 [Hyalomma asiaticum]|uniref:Uncharacterized protein n=1 Tax=Hyalomma asiaticum TaxID=266040 RepID=A0ACB7RY31_HYAAI|nr:hypothetical protein HPB50_021248 [Hyalomma asiaticum]